MTVTATRQAIRTSCPDWHDGCYSSEGAVYHQGAEHVIPAQEGPLTLQYCRIDGPGSRMDPPVVSVEGGGYLDTDGLRQLIAEATELLNRLEYGLGG